MKRALILCLALAASLFASAQGSRYLNGRVVELIDGGERVVSKMTVSIENFHYDITDADGNFKLALPSDREFVTIVLEPANLKILSPYLGLTNLPPDEPFRILVCGAENRRLQARVDELNRRVARAEKEKQLGRRQIASLHKALLDTVLHFEHALIELDRRFRDAALEQSAALKLRDERIRELEDSVRILVQAVSTALEEKFLRQKQVYDGLSAELLAYADRLKEIADRASAEQLPMFFRSEDLSNELNRTILRYNEARAAVLGHHKGHVLAVRQYWSDPALATELEATYRYLFDRVHQTGILPLDSQVFNCVRLYESRQLGRPQAEKKARQAAGELLPELNVAIGELETKITRILQALSSSI
jgi:hypothetical protein